MIISQTVVCLINCITGLFVYKKSIKNDLGLKYIFTFCLLDLATGAFLIWYNFTDLIISHFELTETVFIVGEILLLPAYISHVIQNKHNWSLAIFLSIVPSLFSFYFFNDFSVFSILISGVYITFYCLKYLNWIFKSNKIIDLSKTDHFWIIIGIMICYTATIPLNISNLLLRILATNQIDEALKELMFILFLIQNIIMHILFNKSFLWKQKMQSSFYYQ